mmetsp:Transcript_22032/g.25514  ORF Transcript_22032/g.25514 Transcript_22032/m.25514 type:complete len:82 (-) Transcript_22032:313-558(-)
MKTIVVDEDNNEEDSEDNSNSGGNDPVDEVEVTVVDVDVDVDVLGVVHVDLLFVLSHQLISAQLGLYPHHPSQRHQLQHQH